MNAFSIAKDIDWRFEEVFGTSGVEIVDCMSNSQGVGIKGGGKLFVKWLMTRLFEQNFGKPMTPDSRRCINVVSEEFSLVFLNGVFYSFEPVYPSTALDPLQNSSQRKKMADRRLTEALGYVNCFSFTTITMVPGGERKCSCLLESWESCGGKWRIRLGNSIVKTMFEAARKTAAESKRKGGEGE